MGRGRLIKYYASFVLSSILIAFMLLLALECFLTGHFIIGFFLGYIWYKASQMLLELVPEYERDFNAE